MRASHKRTSRFHAASVAVLLGCAVQAVWVSEADALPVPPTNKVGEVLSQPGGEAVLVGTSFTGRSQITAIRLDRHGRIDRTFGGRAGRVSIELPTLTESVLSAGQLSNGKLLVVADAGADSIIAVRLTRNGRLDSGYGVDGFAVAAVPSPAAAAVSPGGEFVAIGNVSESTPAGPVGHLVATRLTAQGSTDPGYGAGGTATITNPSAGLVATTASPGAAGGVLIGGTYQPIDDRTKSPGVFRLDAHGSLDASFGSGGIQLVGPTIDQYGFASASVVDELPDGRISVGGQVGKPNPAAKTNDCEASFVARLGAGGAPDPGFGSAGIAAVPTSFCDVADAVNTPDGSTLTLSFGFAATLNRVGPTGVLEESFPVDKTAGIAARSLRASAAGLALEPGGGLLVGMTLHGKSRHFPTIRSAPPVVTAFSLARFNSDGSRDRAYGVRGLATWPKLAQKRRTR